MSNDGNQTQLLVGALAMEEDGKKSRQKSFVWEIGQLKREVNNEITREIKEGLIDFYRPVTGPSSATHRKSKNDSTERVTAQPRKTLKPNLWQTAKINPKFTALRIGDATTHLERQNNELDGNIK